MSPRPRSSRALCSRMVPIGRWTRSSRARRETRSSSRSTSTCSSIKAPARSFRRRCTASSRRASTRQRRESSGCCTKQAFSDGTSGSTPFRRRLAVADVSEAERRGLIARRSRRGPTGSPTFVFRHGLILRRGVLVALEGRARACARPLLAPAETAAGERAQEYAEIVAYHAERAYALAHELEAGSADDLGRRAFTLLSHSAAGASARGEFRASRE